MAALPASGGVRSLLAKFENSNNTSNADVSPSRGRTSGESTDNAPNRPLSKVRASFVSVDRNGQGSPTPGMLRRTESYGTDANSSQRSATVSPTGQLETASASPFSPSPQKIRTALAAFQGDPVVSVNEKLASLAVRDSPQPSVAKKPETKLETKLETTQEQPPPAAPVEKPLIKATQVTQSTSTKQPAPSRTIKKSASTMAIAKESSASKATTKSTTVQEKKPTGAPTRSATTTTRPKTQADKPIGHRTAAVRNTAPTARAERSKTPSQDAIKRPSMQPSPQNKPASKSPTRPVRLPASLVTPTAASAARTGALARSQSHLNLRSSPKTETAKTLSRKPSTLKPDTSRLATHTIPDRPRSRMSTTSSRAPQEESFLARMMRPTASSASKMHDKIEPRSPPRLAKAANITPKKEAPAKVVEDKTEKHEKSVQDSPVPVRVKAAVKETVERPVVKKAPVEVATGGKVEKVDQPVTPVTPVAQSFNTEPEVSNGEPLSESHDLEVVPEVAAEPSPEPTAAEAEPEAPAESSSDPAVPNVKPEVPTESSSNPAVADANPKDIQDQSPPDEAEHTAGLASVPETVQEKLEDITEEAVPETQQPEAKADLVEEPATKLDVPQEEAQQPAEESPRDDEVKATEPVQSSEEPAPVASEDTPVEPSVEPAVELTVEKAEESQVEDSTEEEL